MQKTLSLLAVVLALGCADGTHHTETATALLTGRVADGDLEEVLLNGSPPLIDDGWSVTRHPDDVVVPVAADGTFEISVPLDEAGLHRLTVGQTTLDVLLSPGWTSQVTIGPASGPGGDPVIEFEGDGSAENRFSQERARLLEDSDGFIRANAGEIFSLDADGFAARIAELRQELLDRHTAFLADNEGTPETYAEHSLADIDYWFKRLELIYPSVHFDFRDRPADVPSSYLEGIARSHLDQPRHLSSASYVSFLDEYVGLVSTDDPRESSRDLPREKLVSRYRAIASLPAGPEVRDYLLGEMFRAFRISYGPRDWGRVLALLREDDPGSAVLAAVEPLYREDMAERDEPDEIRVFEKVDGIDLEAHIFLPEGTDVSTNRPAYLFFHGGGWAIGTPEWGYANCKRMADLGMVAITFEYRLADVHGTSLLAGVEDVQSAVRWARQQAGQLRIDPQRIVAAGFSAGGHLAGTAAMVDLEDDSGISAKPNALILHSSSYNLTKSRFFYAMTEGNPEAVSLQHQVAAGLVPTLLFHGTYDHLAPIDEFQAFVAKMESLDNDFEHHIFDVGHFFRDADARSEVGRLTEEFLVRKGLVDVGAEG